MFVFPGGCIIGIRSVVAFRHTILGMAAFVQPGERLGRVHTNLRASTMSAK